ncbi:ATP-binding cassette domain-containing protein [Desulfosarcina cetonica]|uniref:ATP-binding cassette domain-containing protein n=1 Tax=Desulfosarcina cetonica TaxID=90730 RepID=UPI000AA01B41|nr:dipeptide/oligopeptide/nickel ABC transporter ATP-binding protein [Desulfosarcina cetonica]
MKTTRAHPVPDPGSHLLELKHVVKHFDISGGLLDQLRFESGRLTRQRTTVKAVNDVSFAIAPGETFSVVGESGCGKSTLARTTIGIYPPNHGQILYREERIDNKSAQAMLPFRRRMQMIFQDPYASLNPRKTVRQTLEEPVVFHNPAISTDQVEARVAEVMSQVGVDPKWVGRYPHEFSGGQRQRISIARA